MKHLAMVLALAFCGAPGVLYAGMEEGQQAYIVGDYAKAMTEFKAAAEQGDAKGQYFTGFLYHHGYGVKRNETEAAKWFRMGASQNEPQSQYYLGVIYENGKDFDKDLAQAHMWLSLAAANPDFGYRDSAHARQAIGKLEQKMSADQIAKAKEMAKSWKPAN